ncbi:MAG: hypothetical protein Pars2KO_00910 [Parasphingorhabdus sp.]
MQVTLKWTLALFGIGCMGIAMSHIALGPSVIPGSVPVNATMDSEDRFYASIFLGFGAAMFWCSQKLAERGNVLQFLLLIFFVGGCARTVSALQVGMPNMFFQTMWALEFILPPVFWFWWRKAYSDTE